MTENELRFFEKLEELSDSSLNFHKWLLQMQSDFREITRAKNSEPHITSGQAVSSEVCPSCNSNGLVVKLKNGNWHCSKCLVEWTGKH